MRLSSCSIMLLTAISSSGWQTRSEQPFSRLDAGEVSRVLARRLSRPATVRADMRTRNGASSGNNYTGRVCHRDHDWVVRGHDRRCRGAVSDRRFRGALAQYAGDQLEVGPGRRILTRRQAGRPRSMARSTNATSRSKRLPPPLPASCSTLCSSVAIRWPHGVRPGARRSRRGWRSRTCAASGAGGVGHLGIHRPGGWPAGRACSR